MKPELQMHAGAKSGKFSDDDRESVFRNIRASLATSLLPSAPSSIPRRNLDARADRPTMVRHFSENLEPLGAVLHRVQDPDEAVRCVIGILRETGAKEVFSWSEVDLPVAGVLGAVREEGIKILEPFLPGAPEARTSKLLELERAGAVISSAWGGLADTGALVLPSGPARPRLASLLAPVHIALLPVSRLMPNMAAFFAAYPDLVRENSNLVFITGPSRTADIELILTRGVHGPRYLHVLLCD
jgi:L-lactate dehydrogenase complex protein LldG